MDTMMLSLLWLVILVQHGDGSTYHVTFLGRDSTEAPQSAIGELRAKTTGAYPTLSSESSCTDVSWVGDDVKTVLLDNPDCHSLLPNGVEVIRNGIKVDLEDDFRLHVYQTDNDGSTGDGYLAIPDEHLGDEYYVTTYCTLGGVCQFAITATEDSTNVVVVFPDGINHHPVCVNDMPIPSSVQEGTAIPFFINEGDTLHFESEDDLSGAYIKADKNVGVVVGTRDALVAGSTSDTSNMIEQIIPTNKWGTEFVVMPNYLNKAGDIIKIITNTDGTVVHIVGLTPFMIEHAGDVVERRIDWQLNSRIMATHPVMILQIMSVDLYNDTDDVTGSPSMVLVPHVGQWTTEEIFYECSTSASDFFALVTMTADSADNITFINVSSINTLVDLVSVEGSEYKVMVAELDPSSENTKLNPGTNVGAYGFCNENSAVLLAADWSIGNSECEGTPSVFADGIDNDCNGLVDESDCTMDDLNLRMSFTQSNHGQTFYKSLSVRGKDNVKFEVSTCDVAMVTLKNTENVKQRLTLMITANEVMYTEYTDVDTPPRRESAPIQSTDCATMKDYTLNLLGSSVTLQYEDGQLPDVPPTGSDPVDYDEVIFSSFIGSAEFFVYQSEKDCPNVYREGSVPDSYGSEFFIPVLSTDTSFLVGLTNIGQTPVNVTFSTSSSEQHTVEALTMVWIEKADIGGTSYSGVTLIVEDDAEVSVYVIRVFSSEYIVGFSLLPSDVLGTTYHLFSPNLTALASEDGCELFSLGFDTEVTGVPTVPQGGSQEIDPTMYDDLGYGKRLQAKRPMSVFCGRENVYVQMPPPNSLGDKYYIPPINFTAIGATKCLINIITVEDSTIVIIRGDYHQLDPVSLTGEVYIRNIESDTLYDIESTKPIQVHLELTGDNLKSVVLVPPVTQYTRSILDLQLPDGSSLTAYFAVGGDGTVIEIPLTWDGFLNTSNGAFIIGIFDYNGLTFVFTNQQNFSAINKQCVITPSIPGDGIDNDCDGLIDEEECTTTIIPGEIDADVDGDINEDCAENTNAPAASVINLEVNHGMTSCATGSGSDYIEIGLTTAPNSGASHFLKPVNTVREEMLVSRPIPSPPKIELEPIPSSTPVPGYTPAPNAKCPYYCPCGWVEIAKNYTKAELQRQIQTIQKELAVSKETLSVTIRKKVSIKDDRVSASTVGWSAVVAVVFMIGSIVVLDLTTLVRDLKLFASNIRQILGR